jgi:hypothetical protein
MTPTARSTTFPRITNALKSDPTDIVVLLNWLRLWRGIIHESEVAVQ